ncbi:MAG: papain-like cysteine protease family protein [Planctomycetota bacterium]
MHMFARRHAGLAGMLIGVILLTGCGTGTPVIPPQIRIADENTPDKEYEVPVSAERGEVARIGPNQFKASCKGFVPIGVAIDQRTPVWCWAACAEMVHNYHGNEEVSQHEIATRIEGRFESDLTEQEREEQAKAAGYDEILLALASGSERPEIRDAAKYLALKATDGGASFDLGGLAESQIKRNLVNSDMLIGELLSGEPVVVGLRNFDTAEEAERARQAAISRGEDASGITYGHIYVAHAAEFSMAKKNTGGVIKEGLIFLGDVVDTAVDFVSTGSDTQETPSYARTISDINEWAERVPSNFDLRSVHLIDPMPADSREAKLVVMTASDFAKKVDFMVSASQARDILETSYLKNERVGDQ